MELLAKRTRFRAYQLDKPGSLFSYFDGDTFTLIEAVLTDSCVIPLCSEILEQCKKRKIDTLHITSWDNDHCDPESLEKILTNLKPERIEIPGYAPHTDSGEYSKKVIDDFRRTSMNNLDPITVFEHTAINISKLNPPTPFEYSNVLFKPNILSYKSNDNSSIELFKSGSFTVASLGDVESPETADFLMKNEAFAKEVDVMILAHHGADNGFTTDKFLKTTKPKVAVCGSNYDNHYDHPDPTIRNLLFYNDIQIYTTKTGDIIIESIGDHKSEYSVTNLQSNSTAESSVKKFVSKRVKSSYSPMLRSLLGY